LLLLFLLFERFFFTSFFTPKDFYLIGASPPPSPPLITFSSEILFLPVSCLRESPSFPRKVFLREFPFFFLPLVSSLGGWLSSFFFFFRELDSFPLSLSPLSFTRALLRGVFCFDSFFPPFFFSSFVFFSLSSLGPSGRRGGVFFPLFFFPGFYNPPRRENRHPPPGSSSWKIPSGLPPLSGPFEGPLGRNRFAAFIFRFPVHEFLFSPPLSVCNSTLT